MLLTGSGSPREARARRRQNLGVLDPVEGDEQRQPSQQANERQVDEPKGDSGIAHVGCCTSER